ncbi:hypothetical protein [Tenacibaculum larymnensis]|uniref:YobI-like P-loop NTPase domain-containing protein n=1 Tax=Tenacibaculum larymnensis TaxID=2878201 RepID=A0A9X4EPS6_9FLAO|nr:hypothetical protein [Tenacibaculum larymnensis]MDE1205980.1 hypothetical protein [Tenacibaculum larymnensis]
MNSSSAEQKGVEVQNGFKLNALTPLVLDENKYGVKTYLDSLKFGIDNKDIHNIALTGSYGSGKSSIIKTFQYKYPKYNYLNISLASFVKNNNLNDEGGGRIDRLIELSILQQLFYRVSHSQTPYSRFRKIKNIGFNELSNRALLVCFILVGLYFLFNNSILYELAPQNPLGVRVVLLILLLFAFHEVFVEVFKALNFNKLSNLNLKDLEIGLSPDDEQSIFNKHLDEIIYFFEVTDYNVVVIEDLDRFRNTLIFTKLREINQLINNSEQIKRQVNFIYAIKDELFDEKDSRVKFFDLIIPVIPVVNSSNSGEKAIEVLKSYGLQYLLEEDFLNVICEYIEDMRLLNNICNEYVIYKKTLGDGLNSEKLFSMITYKNLFPEDFSMLHKNEGFLYEMLNSNYVDELKEEMKVTIKDKIKLIDKKIQRIEEEKIGSYEDLKALYVNKLHHYEDEIVGVDVDGVNVKLGDLTKDEYFDKLKGNNDIKVYKVKNQYYSNGLIYTSVKLNYGFADLEKKLSIYTFDERVKMLFKEELEELLFEKGELEDDIDEVERMNFQLLSREMRFEGERFRGKGLILFLLKNGYINENYHDYISHFHGIIITQKDSDYLKHIRSGFEPIYNYPISKLENFVKKMNNVDFQEDGVLNISILNCLLGKNKYSYKRDLILKKILMLDDLSIGFIDLYFEKGQYQGVLLNYLCSIENGVFWNSIENDREWSKQKEYYLDLIVKNVEVLKIKEISLHTNLKEFISESDSFIYRLNSNTDKVIELISVLDIKFSKVRKPLEDEYSVYYHVFENHFYELNVPNVELYMKEELGDEFNEVDFNKSNYSFIHNSGLNYLVDYVESKIQNYVDNVLLLLDNGGDIEEKYFLKLLNNEFLSLDTKLELIERLNCKIKLLSSLEDSYLITKVFNEDKLKYNWHNIVSIYKYLEEDYKDESFIENIISVLNEDEVYNEIERNRLDNEEYDYEEYSRVINSIIKNDSLSHSSFFTLFHTIGDIELNFDFTQLSDNKLKSLVAFKLNLSPELYSILKENYREMKLNGEDISLHISLIEKDIDVLLDNYDDYFVDSYDLYELVKRKKVDGNKLVLLLAKMDTSEIIQNIECLRELSLLLVKHHYSGGYLYKLLIGIFNLSRVSVENKMELINIYFNNLNLDGLRSLFSLLPEPYSNILKERSRRVKIKENGVNYSVINKLKNKNYISSYKLLVNYIEVNAKNKF